MRNLSRTLTHRAAFRVLRSSRNVKTKVSVCRTRPPTRDRQSKREPLLLSFLPGLAREALCVRHRPPSFTVYAQALSRRARKPRLELAHGRKRGTACRYRTTAFRTAK